MLRKVTAWAAALGVLGALAATPALAASTHEEPKDVHWSFEGPFGRFDPEQLQRGLKVYREVCSACHSMNLVSFQSLGEKGGPFYDAKYKKVGDNAVVKAFAKDFQIDDIDTDTGDRIKRPGTPADHFPAPYPNEYAAKAGNGGALPPDMSLLAKAREGGPAYIYSIVSPGGYVDPLPAGLKLAANQHYNIYMPGDLSGSWTGDPKHVPIGGVIAMPPPLATDNKVTYDDGTKATREQMAKDVAAFLYWAAEPKQDERKQLGLAVMIYLLLFTGLLYGAYRQVWKNESH
jgi:ubiquinol-cytochrome c reductase cytochrome c1 subunit